MIAPDQLALAVYREERLWQRRTKRKKIPREAREGIWCPIAGK